MSYRDVYRLWVEKTASDVKMAAELAGISGNEAEIEDRFYRDLEFGTGGLRGVIGAGCNRMNPYTVARATQGYSNYLKSAFPASRVAIAYDSRNCSEAFARVAAEVFAANGIEVFLYRELMPTPSLSFAVRHLGCRGGIVITASHNPAKYNGYKVYGPDGCQITLEVASAVLAQINAVDTFRDVARIPFEEGVASGRIRYVGEETVDAYIKAVSSTSVLGREVPRDVSIVYTPLNGAGLRCVTRCLRENGFTNITLVPEQKDPDGNFPTCPYPNPEIREALECGLRTAREVGSELLLATDPDCDRVGTAVLHGGDYVLLSGNQMGVLLLQFICEMRRARGTMPQDPVAVKTIVTTECAQKVADAYGVTMRNVLTGFKFIGEQIGEMERQGTPDRYIFGFEESYGYLSGTYVRDKDAVNASLLICEMFAYYKAQGRTLIDVLHGIYERFGFFSESLRSFAFEGARGFGIMKKVMQRLREDPPAVATGRKLIRYSDYQTSTTHTVGGGCEPIALPVSDVIKLYYEGDVTVVARPSGTEPKLKVYYMVKGETEEESAQLVARLETEFAAFLAALA